MPALKRIMFRVGLPGALKRSSPRINAGASTQRLRTGLFPQPVKAVPLNQIRPKIRTSGTRFNLLRTAE